MEIEAPLIHASRNLTFLLKICKKSRTNQVNSVGYLLKQYERLLGLGR